MKKNEYSKDLDTLVALVSYLAFCQYKSMRPSRISDRLSLNVEEVRDVLERYKGLFRKSNRTNSESGEHYFTLHMRYAQRREEGEIEVQEEQLKPLTSEQFDSLLKFITDKAAHEEGFKVIRIKNWITMVAALIAAVAAIFGTLLK